MAPPDCAEFNPIMACFMALRGARKVNQPLGFRRSAAGSGHTCNCDGQVDWRPFQRAFGHGACCFFGYRAESLDRVGGNPQQL